MDYTIETVWLKSESKIKSIKEFLDKFSLKFEEDIDYSVIIKDKNQIIGTCSKSGNIVKCLAIMEDYRGYGISIKLMNNVMDRIFQEGFSHIFAFTENKNMDIFESLGFNLIYNTKSCSVFENGVYDIKRYLDLLDKKYSIGQNEKGALVMNCNPMTLGHLHLIEFACSNEKEVLLFVVEEDKSIFKFKDRIKIIKDATEHLKNLKVIESGEYIISSATFPTYFIKKEDERIKTYTEIDVGIFGRYFCKKFNIKRRYVAEEPFDLVTNQYNSAMKEILPKYGTLVCEIERAKINEIPVSASYVRKLIFENKLDEAFTLMPKASSDFLKSDDGRKIIEIIQREK